jgi:hypothetical protein
MSADVILSPGVVLLNYDFAVMGTFNVVTGTEQELESLPLERSELEVADVEFKFGDTLTIVEIFFVVLTNITSSVAFVIRLENKIWREQLVFENDVLLVPKLIVKGVARHHLLVVRDGAVLHAFAEEARSDSFL